MEKKQGFTLAEVLITLVIIGIIASMTLPSLLGGTNKQELKTGLQKAMSTLSQAVTLHYALTGEDFSSITSYENFAKTRLNAKDINGNIVTTADGMMYNFANASRAAVPSTQNYVDVDVNGRKGPTVSSNTSVEANGDSYATSDSSYNLSKVKDTFRIYVSGTTVTVSQPNTTNGLTSYTRTNASDFLEDCVTASGNSCASSSSSSSSSSTGGQLAQR